MVCNQKKNKENWYIAPTVYADSIIYSSELILTYLFTFLDAICMLN